MRRIWLRDFRKGFKNSKDNVTVFEFIDMYFMGTSNKYQRQRRRKYFSVLSNSAIQTRSWGRRLGCLLKEGGVIGLIGELGSGKTCFLRGLAEGLEVNPKAWVRSPSFTLINEYDGKIPLFHIDLFRITNGRELEGLNLREYLYSDGVCAIEWFENLPKGEVKEFIQIVIDQVSWNKRKLSFTAYGYDYEIILQRISQGRRGNKRGSKGDGLWA